MIDISSSPPARSGVDGAGLVRGQVVAMVALQLCTDPVQALVQPRVVLVPGRVQALEACGRLSLPGPEQRLHLAVQLLELRLDLRYEALYVLRLRLEHIEVDTEAALSHWQSSPDVWPSLACGPP